MKAVIMAGGEGQRLRPLTCTLPKPMVPVLNRPVMEYCVDLLKKHGISSVATTLQYLPEKIQDHFGDGTGFGVQMRHFLENQPLGTAGSVKNAEDFLDETFVVLSGDAITDIDLSAALAFHRQNRASATIVLKQVEVPLEYGVVIIDKNGCVQRFLEKPAWGEVFSDYANTGIYILEPEIFDYIPKGEKTDFAKDVFPKLLADGVPMFGYVAEGYWCDIGGLDQYIGCQWDILDGKCDVDTKAQRIAGNLIQEGAPLPGGNIQPPCFVAASAYIHPEAMVGPYSVIGDNVKILAGASVKRSILWQRCAAGEGAVLRGAVMCEGAEADEYAEAYEGAVVGHMSVVGEKTKIMPGVGIWPYKVVECGCEVQENIVWGSVKRGVAVSESRVSGRLGVELSPELISRLGSAFARAAVGSIALGHDSDAGAVMLYEAFCAGVLAEGYDVFCLEDGFLPALQFTARTLPVAGSVFIRCSHKTGIYCLEFFDREGLHLARKQEKVIEDTYAQRRFQRPDNPGRIALRGSMMQTYIASLSALADGLTREMTVAVGCGNPAVMDALDKVLRAIGVEMVVVEHVDDMHAAIQRNQAAFGAWIEGSGASVVLFDETGQALDQHFHAAFPSFLRTRYSGASTGVLPVGLGDEVYDWFLGSSGRVVVSKSSSDEVVRTFLQHNELVEEQAALAYGLESDGLLLTAMTARALTETDKPLRELYPASRGKGEPMAQQHIDCRNREIGKIMRSLYEMGEADKNMPEGVKINHEKGWAVVLPAGQAGIRVIAQGADEEYAAELADFYTQRIKNIMDD
ncbi:MAG: sugar phosphate nucleotidyltransferase [Christensenellales bacterium]|jgi:mannose-1-phosphate guanylyltransferase/phosphomannomutase